MTVAESAVSSGVSFVTVAPSLYEHSGFTGATMRGSTFYGVDKVADRFTETLRLLSDPAPKVVYLYIPELDQMAHARGSESISWLNQLEDLDSLVRDFVSDIPKHSGVILTADHGVVDVPKENHIYLDDIMPLSEFKFVGGDTRSLYLYFQDSVDVESARNLLEQTLSESCYICTPEDLVNAGYWKTLSSKSANVAPDLLVLARKRVALYHRGFAKVKSLAMVGHHGSITNERVSDTVTEVRFLESFFVFFFSTEKNFSPTAGSLWLSLLFFRRVRRFDRLLNSQPRNLSRSQPLPARQQFPNLLRALGPKVHRGMRIQKRSLVVLEAL